MIELAICHLLTKELVYHKIIEVSQRYAVSESAMTYVVTHEAPRTKSGDFLPCGNGDENLTDPAGNPHLSRGVVQINKYYHPEITDDEAYNVDFALAYLAQSIAEGRGHEWTEYRAYQKLFLKNIS